MKSNLQLFRESIKEECPSESIQSYQQFKQLIDHLCDNKLLQPLQVKKLQHRFAGSQDIKFPINFQQLEQIIMTQFGDKHYLQMLDAFNNLKVKIRQVKGVLNIWKDKGLSTKERYELQSIFQQGNSQMREFFDRLTKEQEILGTIYEQEQQMIDSLQEWIHMQKIQKEFRGYQEYQSAHSKLIQQSFSRLRVREVHFKQRVNTLKVNKIEIMVGMDSRNDEPVEVTLIPKRSMDMQELNIELLTFNARKQLMLSCHFPRFLGYNTHSDPNCYHYFCEFTDGVNLARLINSSQIELEEDTPIFQYWASQLFQTFSDLYQMCSYVALLPLQLEDFSVANGGLRVMAKNIKFADFREENEPEYYEAELLQNLGGLMMALLKIDSRQWDKQVKMKQIDNKNMLSCLLHAKMGHQHFRAGRVNHYLSFFNAQTHPLFENGKAMNGETVLDNFEAIKHYK